MLGTRRLRRRRWRCPYPLAPPVRWWRASTGATTTAARLRREAYAYAELARYAARRDQISASEQTAQGLLLARAAGPDAEAAALMALLTPP